MADRISVVRSSDAPSERLTWGVFAAALAVPLVGVIAGFHYVDRRDPSQRCAARMWLCAALCSSLIYIFVLTRWSF